MKPWTNRRYGLGASIGLVLFFLMMTAGCGGRATGTITGTVTYLGNKVPSAKVTFYGPDLTVSTSTEVDGTYKASNVPLGLVKVTVTTARVASSRAQVAQSPVLKQKGYVPSAEKMVTVPRKYSDPQQSNISLNVIEGAQPFDIDLK